MCSCEVENMGMSSQRRQVLVGTLINLMHYYRYMHDIYIHIDVYIIYMYISVFYIDDCIMLILKEWNNKYVWFITQRV